MSRQVIYVGEVPNDGTGDSLRTGAAKVNSNFEEVYLALENFSYTLPTASISQLGGVKIDGSTIIINNQGVISATSTVPTNITGNAGTVTNGVYVTGSYADPTWITSLAYTKLTGAPALYSLPPATTATLGGVIVDGTSISIDHNTSVIQANANQLVGTSLATNIVSIGANTGSTTVNNNLVVSGNLDVKGSTTYVESSVIQVADKNIELATSSSPTDILADAGGITLRGTTNKTLAWSYASASWTSSENIDLNNGKSYKIGGVDVVTATTLGSGVVNSSLTSVGTLSSLTVGASGLSVNSSVGIATNQTTFPLINATATTVNAFGAATAITFGANTGTLTIANPTITGTNATTLNLNGSNPSIATSSTGTASVFNTTALTVNVGGAATAVNLGASTGTLTIANPTITGTNATVLNLNGASPSIATSSTGTASVFNTNALTVNVAGAATKTYIGSSTGYSNVKNSLVITGASNVTLTNVLIIGTGGQLQCDATILKIGDSITVSGSLSGTSTITGYSNPTTYYIIATDGSTTFTLSAVAGGAAISTTAGTTTGLTFIINRGAIVIDSSRGITTTQTSINVFNDTATTVSAFGASTSTNIGASSGTHTINNPTLTLANGTTVNVNGANPTLATSSTGTVTLFNTNATTVNAFGAATAISIGASTGTLTIANPTITGTNVTTLNLNGASPSISTSSTGTASIFNANALTGALFGAATTISIGNTATAAQSVNMFTASTGASTYNFATGATTNGTTKSINIGTNGVSGSTTNITIGSATGGGATTIYNFTLVSPTVGTSLVTASTSFDLLNTNATTLNIGGSVTSLSIGNVTTSAQTINMFTASTGASTYNFATGATTSATTKTLNIGTGGAASSTTNINIGSTNGGTLTVNAPTLTTAGSIRLSGATSALGFTTGAGGTIAQITSRTTAVALSKPTGQITLFATTTTAGQIVSFTVTNTTVAATDNIIVNHASGGTLGSYIVYANNIQAGQFNISVYTPAAIGSAEAPVLNFTVIKGVNA